MIRSGSENAIGRKIVKLQEKGRNNPLYLAGFVKITTFLSDCIELIEEEDTRFGSHEIKEALQPLSCFTKIACDYCVISYREERKCQLEGKALGKGGLAVSWRSKEQDSVTRLQTMGTQYFGSPLLFDKFLTCGTDGLREKEASQWSLGVPSLDTPGPVPDTQITRLGRADTCGPGRCCKNSGDPLGNNRVLLGPLVCSDRFSGNPGRFLVSAYAGLYKINNEIASGHRVSSTSRPNGILALISPITTGFASIVPVLGTTAPIPASIADPRIPLMRIVVRP